ncbi:MAG: DRTGG domain-containing protein [Dehalococcoidales bacterium]|nr:DRTGG domain-containing protein [Dehalococcoidales bacterium]
MIALLIVSAEAGAGKTAIGAGLGKRFESQGKSVTIEERTLGATPEDAPSKAVYDAALDAKAKVIIVAPYAGRPALKPAASLNGFQDNPAGLVINKVPLSQLNRAREEAAVFCEKAGIKFLGALPEDRAVAALTAGEVAQGIGGSVLNAAEKTDALIENIMLGALVVDSGPDYFGRKENKAAVLRNDRADMQLAALETSMRCLVLSGSRTPPISNVMIKANRKGVPVIASEKGTEEIINAIEDMLDKARFHPAGKIDRVAALIQQYLNVKIIDEWAVG